MFRHFSPVDGCAFGCKPLYGLLQFELSHDVVIVVPKGADTHTLFTGSLYCNCTPTTDGRSQHRRDKGWQQQQCPLTDGSDVLQGHSVKLNTMAFYVRLTAKHSSKDGRLSTPVLGNAHTR